MSASFTSINFSLPAIAPTATTSGEIMQGEFRGDFSRNTFDPVNRFSQVLMQQGRVQLDADWNEQSAIVLHYLRTLAADLIGPHAGTGFEIALPDDADNSMIGFTISTGHYYVDGILCENDGTFGKNGQPTPLSYYDQLHYPRDRQQDKLPPAPFLVYLDVWERHVSYLDVPQIREVALAGADTASRAQVVWQVKVTDQLSSANGCDHIQPSWDELVETWQPQNRGQLKARSRKPKDTDSPACITPPESRYRGAENQLYRIEIHRGGPAGEATFKWSRDNSAIAARWLANHGNDLLIDLLIDGTGYAELGFSSGQWVELIDDRRELLGQAGVLVKLVTVEGQKLTIDPATATGPIHRDQFSQRAKVRRWDHPSKDSKDIQQGGVRLANDHAILIQEGNWISVESGIEIQFQTAQPGATYRTGDYWLIPARTETGDIEWSRREDGPAALPPHGIEHHYAPLAVLLSVDNIKPCRQQIQPIGRTIER
jgi:hypothetical protein